MALETTADNLYFQVSAGVIVIIPNRLINLEHGETTVKHLRPQHLLLSRNSYQVHAILQCVLCEVILHDDIPYMKWKKIQPFETTNQWLTIINHD